jgi:CubicO group peptidase (beta-lactamase class C family)
MKFNQLIGVTLLAMCVAFSAFAQSLPIVSQPDELGLSSQRLRHLTQVFQSDIDGGKIPGVVVLVARAGKIAYFEALGFQDRENRIPMKSDAIFRLASMTKPIASVALMMLVEEGKIQIDDPLWFYLPEFKDLKVGVEKVSSETGKPQLVLEPALKAPTIQDLLRHTSGFAYDLFGTSLVVKAYQAVNIRDPNQTLAEFATKLAGLPLAHQPGTTWEYSVSTDVLGRVVEVVSGVSFDRFLSDRIFKPLGMTSTGFYVTESQVGRVAEPQVDSTTGKRPVMRDMSKRPNFMSGSGGLSSTAADYFRFSQMLLNGGELDGVRLLSRRTVALMTADHLPPGTPIGAASQVGGSLVPSPDNGQGFGLGFAVRVAQGHNPYPGSPGEFYWVGATGPAFWVDPKEKLIAIMMVQAPSQARHYRSLIRNLVYQSLID